MKEGFDIVWSSFCEALFRSNDLDMDLTYIIKEAQMSIDVVDDFSLGQKAAFDYIANIPDRHLDWMLQIKIANDQLKNGHSRNEVISMMKEASMDASSDVDANKDLLNLIKEGPMNRYELGKYAALVDLSNIRDEGWEVCIQAANQTINAELQKNASEDDQLFRLGAEALCFEFLKEANRISANGGTFEDIYESVLSMNENLLMKAAMQPEVWDAHCCPPNLPPEVPGFVHSEDPEKIGLDAHTKEMNETPDRKCHQTPSPFAGIGNWKKSEPKHGLEETPTGGGVYTIGKSASIVDEEAVSAAISTLEELNLI